MSRQKISRREFLKISAAGLGGLALSNSLGRLALAQSDFPSAERLGRVVVDLRGGWVNLLARPDNNAEKVGVVYEDTVVPWLRETVGSWSFRNNQRFVETPDGYLWSAYVQPVQNNPNRPVASLPQADGEEGMWVEVSVPWVNAVLANPPVRSAWFRFRVENQMPLRFYYSQILWVDQLRIDESGQTYYRVNERYGNPGDMFWVPAEGLRPITREELAPIRPDVEDKRIVVRVDWKDQTLSCYEGNQEVYFCKISSGQSTGSTPLSAVGSPGFAIWRKLHSLQMSGASSDDDGWQLPGIGWTSLFHGDGVAIHSTYWHNNFGEPMSHGCVNARPEDAKWIFRWTKPVVPFMAGDIDVTIDRIESTHVTVIEA